MGSSVKRKQDLSFKINGAKENKKEKYYKEKTKKQRKEQK